MKSCTRCAKHKTSKSRSPHLWLVLLGLAIFGTLGRPALAQPETKQVRIAVQFGVAYLPLLVAEDQGLFAKHLSAVGLKDTEVTLVRFSGAPAVSDAMLSRSVEFGTYGTTGFLTAWDRSRGNVNIKGLCGIAIMQSVLLANRPDIKSVTDFKPEDRISVPATVAPQAQVLRMAAEKAFGPGQHGRLDGQISVLPHPEGLRALVSKAGVVAQITSPPFDSMALQSPGIHKVLTSDDVLGGPSTFILLATTESFARDNPLITRAMLQSADEAMRFIKENRKEAAAIYLKAEKSNMGADFIERLLADPANDFQLEPLRVMQYVEFMKRTKALRNAPSDWKELFLPLIADRNGS